MTRILAAAILSFTLIITYGCIDTKDSKGFEKEGFSDMEKGVPYPEDELAPDEMDEADRLDTVPEGVPNAVDDPGYTGDEGPSENWEEDNRQEDYEEELSDDEDGEEEDE